MLAASLAGCGGSASNNAKNDAATNEVQNANKGDSLENGEIVKLRVWGFAYTATSEECAAIAEAVSEITRDKIGVEVELVRNSDGEKLNLALTSGEQLDLVNYHTYAGGLSALVTNGMAMPIDDLAKEYAQEATMQTDMVLQCEKMFWMIWVLMWRRSRQRKIFMMSLSG